MVIPYKNIVLAHKLVFILLYLNVLSSIFVWYSFTAWMHFLLGVIYFYTLFKIEWKPKVSGRPVFVFKVIAETLLALWLMLLSFTWLLGMRENTIASGKGYKLKQDGFNRSYCVLYHHLYIVERPYAYLMDLVDETTKDGQITNIAINKKQVTIAIDTQTYDGYLFGKK